MAIVKLQKFYPSNNITDAAEANANNTAINGSTGARDRDWETKY